ncbi:MAG: CBS domain-containing protein [Bacteroidota bacterium]
MIAKQLISEDVPLLKPSDSVSFAVNRMDESRLTHLPVVDEGDFIGVLSEQDCATIYDPELSVLASNLILSDLYVTESDHIYEVVKSMTTRNMTMLPVVNNQKRFMGAIPASRLLPHLANMIAVNNPGGIIVLEINENDYNLTEIAHIIESNDARILSLSLTSFPNSTRLDITIKVNRIEIGPILQTFFRFNYLVKDSWSKEDAYHEGLHDRFDALMNYLNI